MNEIIPREPMFGPSPKSSKGGGRKRAQNSDRWPTVPRVQLSSVLSIIKSPFQARHKARASSGEPDTQPS